MKKLFNIPVLLMILLAKLIPFNWIIGSFRSTFSLTTVFAPVLAKQFGFGWISLFFISNKFASFVFNASFQEVFKDPVFLKQFIFLVLFSSLHRTPLLFAAQAYNARHWSTSIAVPALCMIAFVAHDVGAVAWCYSLYWLIPMLLYFVKDSTFTRALSASFVAHAVGSVIWLYTGNIAAVVWIGLIPVVFCERLLMAGGMIALDGIISYVRSAQPWKSLKLGLA